MFENTYSVVTGAASGLGKDIAISLVKQGSNVLFVDYNEEGLQEVAKECEALGYQVPYLKVDVSKDSDVAKIEKFIAEEFGSLDYWVNAAGISIITPYFDHTEEIWDRTLDINLKGQFLCNKVAIKYMLKKGKGSIVNLSSQSGKVGTDSYQAYCSSKFGVIGLTQSLAKEFGPKNIRVNAVAPGVVYTAMWDKQKADYAQKKGMQADEVMDYFQSKIPLRRLGTVEDVTHCVEFLLSDLSSYITGQTINVNGGDIMF